MVAMVANDPNRRGDGKIETFPVEAGAHIFDGAIVAIVNPDTDGYLTPAADTLNQQVVGVAVEEADNTGGADGDEEVRVRIDGAIVLCVGAGFDVHDVGVQVYATDDQTVTKVVGSAVFVGKIAKFVSATSVWVKLHALPAVG